MDAKESDFDGDTSASQQAEPILGETAVETSTAQHENSVEHSEPLSIEDGGMFPVGVSDVTKQATLVGGVGRVLR